MQTENKKELEIKNYINNNKIENVNKLYNEFKDIEFKKSIQNIYNNLKEDELGCNSLIRLFSEECSSEFGLDFETYFNYLENNDNYEIIEIPDEYSFETDETDYLVRLVEKNKNMSIYKLLDRYIEESF